MGVIHAKSSAPARIPQALKEFGLTRATKTDSLFKKNGGRAASVVVHWGRRHRAPVCLVSDLGAHWHLLAVYRRRFPIEALFRDYKSSGWHWEQGQVTDLQHVEHLLVGMALATWVAVSVGTCVVTERLRQPPIGHRRTVPWLGKRSLFTLGLHRLGEWINTPPPIAFRWLFTDWEAPHWQTPIYFHPARAFVFAA